MDYAETMTPKEMEYELIEWAVSDEDSEDLPTCLNNWYLNEDQLEIIKDACAVPHAAASIANAMCSITVDEGLATIAEALIDCR